MSQEYPPLPSQYPPQQYGSFSPYRPMPPAGQPAPFSGREKGWLVGIAILVVAVIVLGFLLYRCKNPSTDTVTTVITKAGSFAGSPDDPFGFKLSSTGPKRPPKGMIRRFVKAAQMGVCSGKIRAISRFISNPSHSRKENRGFSVDPLLSRKRGFDVSPDVQALIDSTNTAFASLSASVTAIVTDMNLVTQYINDPNNAGKWTIAGVNGLAVKTARGKALATGIIAMITDFDAKKGQSTATSAQIEALMLWMESLGTKDVWVIGTSDSIGDAIYENINTNVLENTDISDDQKTRILMAFAGMYETFMNSFDKIAEVTATGSSNAEIARSIATSLGNIIANNRLKFISADLGAALSNVYSTPVDLSKIGGRYSFPGFGGASFPMDTAKNPEFLKQVTAYNYLWSRIKRLEYIAANSLGAAVADYSKSTGSSTSVEDPAKSTLYAAVDGYAQVLNQRLNSVLANMGNSLSFTSLDYTKLPDGWRDTVAGNIASGFSDFLRPWRDAVNTYGSALENAGLEQFPYFNSSGNTIDPASYAASRGNLLLALQAFASMARSLGILSTGTYVPMGDLTSNDPANTKSVLNALSKLQSDLSDAQSNVTALSGGMTRTMTAMGKLQDMVTATGDSIAISPDINVTPPNTADVSAAFEALPPEYMEEAARKATGMDIHAERLGMLIDALHGALRNASSEGVMEASDPYIEAIFEYHMGLVRQLRGLEEENARLKEEMAMIQAEMSAKVSEEKYIMEIMKGTKDLSMNPGESQSEIVHMAAGLRRAYDDAIVELNKLRSEYDNLAYEMTIARGDMG